MGNIIGTIACVSHIIYCTVEHFRYSKKTFGYNISAVDTHSANKELITGIFCYTGNLYSYYLVLHHKFDEEIGADQSH